jgi:hypothetical protein
MMIMMRLEITTVMSIRLSTTLTKTLEKIFTFDAHFNKQFEVHT